MDCLFGIIIFSFIFYHIGFTNGKKKGKKDNDELNYHNGYKEGIKIIEEEIYLLSKLSNTEIIKRIKNLGKKYENKFKTK